jgi:hypothetical protein
MIEYIYLVKCPDRMEEPFDFFDEAKDFAIGCLGSNPIITQIEVDRNDFGECVDSRDLGTIWSWEDMVKETETEPAASVFTKDDLVDYVPETDPEFAALDDTLDAEVLDTIPDNFRKPIPDGMTIKDLVEEMEENEDTVECTWCEDLFDKSECRYEINLGWLCSRCQAAIMSRGETLTFRENSYWDFLDEDTDVEIDEEDEKTEEASKSMIEELEDADAYKKRLTLCPECGDTTTFDNETGMCINCGFNTLTEDVVSDKIEAACKEKVDLDYSNIEVTGMSAKRDVDDWDEWTELRDFVYTVDKQDIIETLFGYVQEEDVTDIGGLKAFEELSDDDAWLYMIDHFDELFEKYEQQLLKYYEDSAAEAAQEDYYERSAWE